MQTNTSGRVCDAQPARLNRPIVAKISPTRPRSTSQSPCLCLFSATIITAPGFIPFKHICTVIQSNGSRESKKIFFSSFGSVTTATASPRVDKHPLRIVLLTAVLCGMTSCNLASALLPHLHVAHRSHQPEAVSAAVILKLNTRGGIASEAEKPGSRRGRPRDSGE